MADTVIGVIALTGALLVLLAGVGVVRFPDVYARMHAATKATTLGITFVGLATALALEGVGAGVKVVLIVAFIFTSPSVAHLVGRAAYRAEGIDFDVEARDDLAERLADANDLDVEAGADLAEVVVEAEDTARAADDAGN